MKNTNKIAAATAMLLVSVLMLSTATFAWFAMNTRSNADGLTVEAYTDSNFLEIKNDEADAEFGIDTTFTESNVGILRLVTPKFFNTAEMVTIAPTQASGEYADENVDYYKLADSDMGAGAKFNYIYANGELELASSLVGLYTGFDFEIVTSDAKVTTNDHYYKRVANKYVLEARMGESAKGYYKPVYYAKYADGSTYQHGNEYFNLVQGEYVKVDTSNGFNNGQTDVSMYYYKVHGVPAALDVENGVTPRYTGEGVYYSLDTATNTFSVVSNLKVGTDLSAYYTLEVTNYSAAAHNANVEYYLANELENGEYDYSYVGKNDNAVVGNYLYWGRAYSNDPTKAQENNTLNIINPNGTNDDAVTNYYLAKTLYLRQAEGTNNASNLRIENVRIGGAKNELSDALRILFVAYSEHDEDTLVKYTYDPANDNGAESKVLFSTLLGNEAETITVEVYIYFDGTDPVANNKQVAGAILNGQTIEIEFAIDELDYNKVQQPNNP